MKNFNPYTSPWTWYGIMGLLWTLMFLFVMSSCSVSKKSHSIKEKKIEVAAADSGRVITSTSQEKKDSTYWKETIIFQPQPPVRDSGITVRNYNTYPPAVIIREGGSKSEESNKANSDSLWSAMMHLLVQDKKETTTEKKTTTSWWDIFLNAFCFIISIYYSFRFILWLRKKVQVWRITPDNFFKP